MVKAADRSVERLVDEEEAAAAARAERLQPRPGEGFSGLERHPQDGWTFADPMFMAKPTRAALRGVIRAMTPPEPAPQGFDGEIEVWIRRVMRYMPAPFRVSFQAVLHLLDFAPMWTLKAPRRLQDLDRDEAAELLEELGSSPLLPLRQIVGTTRSAVMGAYYDQEVVLRELGYDAVSFMRGRMELRRRLLAGEAATRADRLGSLDMHEEDKA